MQTSERELPAVFLDVLHSSNQNRESRAVDVSDARKIDHEPARLLANHLAESRSYPGRDVQIDFAYQRQNIFFFRKGHACCFFWFEQVSFHRRRNSIFRRTSRRL